MSVTWRPCFSVPFGNTSAHEQIRTSYKKLQQEKEAEVQKPDKKEEVSFSVLLKNAKEEVKLQEEQRKTVQQMFQSPAAVRNPPPVDYGKK